MKTIITSILICFAFGLSAQNVQISGTVTDSTGAPMPAVSLVLMTVEDSLMSSFGLSKDDGSFTLKAEKPGSYLVQYNYVGFTTAWQAIEVKENSSQLELEPMVLYPSSEVLPYVEISAERNPIRFSRDTVEYDAKAFQVNPEDVVEDLLEQMPGIEVESDGTVKAHGETVENVLVDGKEFFGKDTRIATKNLPAEAVDKVQVYDQKSDMAEFTGVEDGQDERTINLNLKEDYKDGYFGRADAGYGTEGRYEGKFNVNRFTPTDRLSAIGSLNNTNQQVFSIEDYIQFMGGIGSFISGGGGRVEIDLGSGVGPGGMGSEGIQSVLAGGLNWSKDFSDKTDFSGSYLLNRFQNDVERSVYRENLGPEGLFVNTEDDNRLSRNFNHSLSSRLEHKIDSSQNIRVRFNGSFSDSYYNGIGITSAFDPSGNLQNDGSRDVLTEGFNYQINANTTYRKRFRKKGRAFILNANGRWSDVDNGSDLMAINNFYDALTYSDSILQEQLYNNTGNSYGVTASYTEPIGKRQYLEFKGSRQNYDNENRSEFYDLSPGQRQLNEGLSNHFLRGYVYDRGELNYLLNRKGFRLTAGVAYQESRMDNRVVDEDTPFKTRFSRLLPSLYTEYELGGSNRLTLDYNTRFVEPSPEQLQPNVDNSDPLNVYIGNPSLQPEYIHSANLGYFLYDQFTFTNLFVNINGSYTQDRITNATSFDSLLRRVTTPVNVDRELALRGSVHFGTPIRPLQIKTRLRLGSSITQRILFVNDNRNDVRDFQTGMNFSIENRKKEKIDARIGMRLDYTQTDWSIDEALNREFTNYAYYTDLQYTPVPRWSVDTRFDYSVYSAETFGERTEIPLWTAGITHYFMKNRKARIRISVYDILGQNQGVSRNSNLNYVEQSRFNVLTRYYMVSVGYNLSGFGKKGTGAIEIKYEN